MGFVSGADVSIVLRRSLEFPVLYHSLSMECVEYELSTRNRAFGIYINLGHGDRAKQSLFTAHRPDPSNGRSYGDADISGVPASCSREDSVCVCNIVFIIPLHTARRAMAAAVAVL